MLIESLPLLRRHGIAGAAHDFENIVELTAGIVFYTPEILHIHKVGEQIDNVVDGFIVTQPSLFKAANGQCMKKVSNRMSFRDTPSSRLDHQFTPSRHGKIDAVPA